MVYNKISEIVRSNMTDGRENVAKDLLTEIRAFTKSDYSSIDWEDLFKDMDDALDLIGR